MNSVKKVSSAGDAAAKGKGKAAKKVKAHPPYVKMIEDAIMTLKERTGSSLYAIAKVMQEKQKSHLPPNFKKILLLQLKKLVATGKLVKVKNSFKLSSRSTAINGVRKPVKPKAKVPSKTGVSVKPKSNSVRSNVKAKSKQAIIGKSLGVKSPAKKMKKVTTKTVKNPKSIKTPLKKAPVKK